MGSLRLALAWAAGDVSLALMTVVQTGLVEPYLEPEHVHLQGQYRNSELTIMTATTWQTPEDALTAIMVSDDAWYLEPLQDCWNEMFDEEFCCSNDPKSKACWNHYLWTHTRCCVLAKAAARLMLEVPQELRSVVNEYLPRYRINNTLWNQRRVRLREGRHESSCLPFQLPLDLRSRQLDEDHGLLGAYDVLLSAGLASRQVFQVGVADGKTGDPVYNLIAERGVGGLGLEAHQTSALRARENRPSSFQVHQAYATPDNIWHWASKLNSIDVVIVDIDSFECALLESLLDGAAASGRELPALLVVEINMVVPPPFKFSREYGDFRGPRWWDQQVSSTSCSLSYAIRSFGSRGYELLSFSYDTMFVRRDLVPLYSSVRPDLRFPQDEFLCYRKARIHVSSRPVQFVREWFFRANDPGDLHQTLELMRQNLTEMSDFEGMAEVSFKLYV